MDSVTQIALGATLAAACVPKQSRRKAALLGAALGTLPDLDVVLDYGDPVADFTYHRGFSHSLFVLLPFSVFLWALLWRFTDVVKQAPKQWLAGISLALVTHPILDAHTAYGTQLFWPLTTPPESWSTLFIIDPLYTLPLLIAMVALLIRPRTQTTQKLVRFGLIASTVYLSWSWVGKIMVEQQAAQQFAGQSIRTFSTPTPFNTLLWRIVVRTEGDYYEGFYSVLSPQQTIQFNRFDRGDALLEQAHQVWAVQRLDWFTRGFIKAYNAQDRLLIADLRMGFEGAYAFTHAVAAMDASGAKAIPSERMPRGYNAGDLQFVWDNLTEVKTQRVVPSEALAGD